MAPATVCRIKLSDVSRRHCSRQYLVPPAVNVSVDWGVFTFCVSGFTYPCIGRDELSLVQDAPVVGMAFHVECDGSPGLKKHHESAPSNSACPALGTAVVAGRSDAGSSGADQTSGPQQAAPDSVGLVDLFDPGQEIVTVQEARHACMLHKPL